MSLIAILVGKVSEIRSRESEIFPSCLRNESAHLNQDTAVEKRRDVYLSNETIGGGIRSFIFAQVLRIPTQCPSSGETTLHASSAGTCSDTAVLMDVVDNQWG